MVKKANPEPNKVLLNDCFLTDKERLSHSEAIEILKSRLTPIAKTQVIELKDAIAAILAKPVFATRNIPSTDNSAVDGYAYNSEDYEQTGGYFPVVARITAGNTQKISIPPRAAARIFTGAVMPEGVDTIAMQEDCESHEQDGASFVAIPPGLKSGANRRLAAEDQKYGDEIATAGEIITPQVIAALVSTGATKAPVFKPLRVAILSSGDELKEPGEAAHEGHVFDSNRHVLLSLLSTLAVEVTDLGILPDNYEIIETTLKKASQSHDIILSSGGASIGDEDHINAALQSLGKRHLWQLAIKPGRPMSFGQIDDTVFFGLPGNPVACFICFLLYVRPALLRLGGADWHEPKRYSIPVNFNFTNKKPDRREFWRGIYALDKAGEAVLEKFPRDGSGLISGLREADGLIEVSEETTSVSLGERLNFIPWSEFGI